MGDTYTYIWILIIENEITKLAGKWLDLECLILSAVTHHRKQKHLFSLIRNLANRLCMYENKCACGNMYRRLRLMLGITFNPESTLFIEAGSLRQILYSWTQLPALGIPHLCSLRLKLQVEIMPTWHLHGSWESEPYLHTCVSSALTTKPSLYSRHNGFFPWT